MGGKSSKQNQTSESFGFNQNLVSRMGEQSKLKNEASKYIRSLKNRTKKFNSKSLALSPNLKNSNNFKTYQQYSETLLGSLMENNYNGKKTEKKYYVSNQNTSDNPIQHEQEVDTEEFKRWKQQKHKKPYFLNKQKLINKLKNNYKNISGLNRDVLFYMYKNPNSNASSFLRR